MVPWTFCNAFGAAAITNYHSHAADVIQYAIGMETSGPVEIIHPNSKQYPTLTCKYANGTLQTLFAETSTTFDLVTIPGAEISSPRVVRLRQGWDAYRRWTTRLIRQSTPTESTT